MTQRPIPAARYSRLLSNDPSPTTATTKPTPSHPKLSTQTLLPQKPLPAFLLGSLLTFLLSLLASSLLFPHLCLAPYHHTTTFTPQPTFSNLSHIYDSQWDAILPANGGFIDHRNGKDDATATTVVVKGVTMFHQLHCLQLLRIALQQSASAENGNGDGDGHEMGTVKDAKGHDMHANSLHYLHCLDYLRQVSFFF
jgi:hypothetical protein